MLKIAKEKSKWGKESPIEFYKKGQK